MPTEKVLPTWRMFLKARICSSGLSVANIVTAEMIKRMSEKPIIFAMANPDPEIPYELAKAARPDAILGTGRSDYPNQVNNVLGFPYIFRGALDVRARDINTEMKLAARSRTWRTLAREECRPDVLESIWSERLEFGPEYVIPKPIDPRLILLGISGSGRGSNTNQGCADRSRPGEIPAKIGRAYQPSERGSYTDEGPYP